VWGWFNPITIGKIGVHTPDHPAVTLDDIQEKGMKGINHNHLTWIPVWQS
jgi:hypothetical protein